MNMNIFWLETFLYLTLNSFISFDLPHVAFGINKIKKYPEGEICPTAFDCL